MAGIRAGAARVVITPPVGIPMWGFANRALPSQSVHDELTATALVIDDGSTRIGIVALDIIALDGWHVAAIRQRAEAVTGISADHLLLSCSHTHSGPLPWLGRGHEELVRPYCDNLTNQITGALDWAARQLRPARLGFGRGAVQIQVNRRERRPDGTTVIGVNPHGPVDPEVAVVRIDAEDGSPLAALIGYACHPVILGPRSYALSADFVGRMRQVFEAATDCPCLYLQGCTGNLNPLGGVTDRYDNCARLGTILAGEAIRVHGEALPVPADRLAALRRSFDLPLAPLPPLTEVEAEIAALRERLETLEAERAPALIVENTRFALRRAERVREEVAAGRTNQAVPFEVQALRLGDVAIVAAPAELFVEIGLAIKERSPFPHTLALGYANGCIGYVPVAEAYPEGGYEVEQAHKGYGQLAAVAPTAASAIIGVALDLLGQLHGAGQA